MKNKIINQSQFSRSRLPLYAQVASLLRQRIKAGEWLAGTRLPTLEDLETEYQVARVTARQAVALLEDEGLVWRKQGKGTFIAETVSEQPRLPLATKWDDLMRMIEGTTMRMVGMEPAGSPASLSPEDGEPAFAYQHLRRVHVKDDAPYCLIDLHIARDLYERAPTAFQTKLALRVISEMQDLRFGSARQMLTIGSADVTTANFLEVEVGTPIAEVRRVIANESGTVIYFAEIVYRGDFVKLDIDLLNNHSNQRVGG